MVKKNLEINGLVIMLEAAARDLREEIRRYATA